MYVCICNQVTDHEIREAGRRGCRRLEDLQHQLGVATNCGCCAEFARNLLEEEAREQSASSPFSPLPQPA